MKMEARLLEKGYKIWERTNHNGKHYKRIYINDFSKYLDIEDKGIDKSGVKYLVVNGIDFSGLKRQAKKLLLIKLKIMVSKYGIIVKQKNSVLNQLIMK